MTETSLKELLTFLPPKNKSCSIQDEDNYQLTMVVWYLISKHRAPLDISLALKYCLVSEFLTLHKQKDDKIKSAFPEFKDLHHLISDYKKQTYKEGHFVLAISLLLPIFNQIQNKEKIELKILEENVKLFEKVDVVREYVKFIKNLEL